MGDWLNDIVGKVLLALLLWFAAREAVEEWRIWALRRINLEFGKPEFYQIWDDRP